MSVGEKDKRILWVRAGGKCSICKIDLIEDASNVSQASIIGENCHISGDKPNAKRYDSKLTDDERSSYPNLILLCRNHHKNIDDDDVTYTTSKLHHIKSVHELWVEGAFKSLSGPDSNYIRLIELITKELRLNSWDSITDHGLRMLLPDSFVQGIANVGLEIHRAIWPGTHLNLENAMKNVSQRADEYITHFKTLGMIDARDFKWWREDTHWKSKFTEKYSEFADKSDLWARECFRLLRNLTIALNEFANEVRQALKPDYLISLGKFGLYDSMGVWNGGEPIVFFPETYQ